MIFVENYRIDLENRIRMDRMSRQSEYDKWISQMVADSKTHAFELFKQQSHEINVTVMAIRLVRFALEKYIDEDSTLAFFTLNSAERQKLFLNEPMLLHILARLINHLCVFTNIRTYCLPDFYRSSVKELQVYDNASPLRKLSMRDAFDSVDQRNELSLLVTMTELIDTILDMPVRFPVTAIPFWSNKLSGLEILTRLYDPLKIRIEQLEKTTPDNIFSLPAHAFSLQFNLQIGIQSILETIDVCCKFIDQRVRFSFENEFASAIFLFKDTWRAITNPLHRRNLNSYRLGNLRIVYRACERSQGAFRFLPLRLLQDIVFPQLFKLVVEQVFILPTEVRHMLSKLDSVHGTTHECMQRICEISGYEGFEDAIEAMDSKHGVQCTPVI